MLESRARMRQGHQVDAIAEQAGLARPPYISQAGVFRAGSVTLSLGLEQRRQEAPPGNGVSGCVCMKKAQWVLTVLGLRS